MNLKNKDTIVRLLLGLNAFFTMILSIVVYFRSNNQIYIVVVLFFLFMIFCIYYYSKYKSYLNAKNIVNKVNYHLSALITNSNIDAYKTCNDDDLIPFFQVLDKVQQGLNKKNESYQEILELVNSVAINIDLDKLLETLIPKLLNTTTSSCGAFYLVNNVTNRLELKSSVGFSRNIYSEFDIAIGEGFLGTFQNEIKIIKDIPDDTIYYMKTFLGKLKPKNVMVVPISDSANVIGVLLLTSIYEYTLEHENILNLIKSYIGIAVSNGLTYEHSKRLANELKFHNTLILDLNNDLEKRIQDRTIFLNSIINSIEGYAIYAIDKEMKVMAWNKGCENVLGYTAEEMIGNKIDIMYTEEQIKTGVLRNRMEKANREGKYEDNGWRTKKDGSRYYANLTVFKMTDKDNKLIGFTSVTRDTTAIRNTQDQLLLEKVITRKLLEGSSRALIITDTKGLITSYNRNACKLLKTKDLKNLNLAEFFEDESQIVDNLKYISLGNSLADWRFNLSNGEGYVVLKITSLQEGECDDKKLLVHLYL